MGIYTYYKSFIKNHTHYYDCTSLGNSRIFEKKIVAFLTDLLPLKIKAHYYICCVVIRVVLTDFVLLTSDEHLYKNDNFYKVFTMKRISPNDPRILNPTFSFGLSWLYKQLGGEG